MIMKKKKNIKKTKKTSKNQYSRPFINDKLLALLYRSSKGQEYETHLPERCFSAAVSAPDLQTLTTQLGLMVAEEKKTGRIQFIKKKNNN